MDANKKDSLDLALTAARATLAKCKKTFRENYENAGLSGLCEEGRWEAAFGSLDAIDLEQIVRAAQDELKI